jgi:elongation factor G
VGLKSVGAGDTLSDPAHPIALDGFEVPDPVIEAAIEPLASKDQQRLGQALAMLARADPSLRISVDHETGAILARGMGELHLQICVEMLKEDFGVAARVGVPQVSYRAAPSRRAEVDHTLRKQTGGPGQMARVRLVLEPLAQGESGLVFVNRIAGGAIPKEFIPAIEKALREALLDGGPSGHPVLGLAATLPRTDSVHGCARPRARDRGRSAARGNVQLRERAALAFTGTGELQHEVRALRTHAQSLVGQGDEALRPA